MTLQEWLKLNPNKNSKKIKTYIGQHNAYIYICSTDPKLWHLSNYKVSTSESHGVYLVPS